MQRIEQRANFAGYIVKTGFELGVESARELADSHTEEQLYNQLIEYVPKLEGVRNCKSIRLRRMGRDVLADMEIAVDPFLSVSSAHRIAEDVRISLSRKL